ncbi:mechanosensitive ion channel family protein [Acidobacteriota bacterium]
MLEKVLWQDILVIDLIVAASVLLLTFIVAKALSIYTKRFLKERVNKDHLQLIGKLISISIFTIGLFSAFAVVGLNLTGILFAGSLAGIIIGFASQSLVGNIISGLFIIIERPLKIGDQVNIDNVTGFVEDIRIISTTIRTYDGFYVRIPNQTVFTTNLTNYVGHKVRRFNYIVGIRYSDDADKAIAIIKEVVKIQPFALYKPKPQIFVDNLGDNAVNIKVRVWAPVSEWYDVKMTLLWKIKKTLEEQGIEIAFPQRTLWFANKLDPSSD